MNFDGIIFDLDGTLWSSVDATYESWNKVFKEEYAGKVKPVTREEVESYMGLQLPQIGEKFFGYIEEKERMKILARCCNASNKLLAEKGGVLYPKIEETLDKLSKAHPLFIVSNCQSGYIEGFMAYHKLEKYFKDTECSGDTRLSKGENIKLIVKRNGLKAPVYVGDTQGDCNSSREAGVPFIYARYGFGEVDSFDYVIDAFEELATSDK